MYFQTWPCNFLGLPVEFTVVSKLLPRFDLATYFQVSRGGRFVLLTSRDGLRLCGVSLILDFANSV